MKYICKVFENMVRSKYYLFKDLPNCNCINKTCKYNYNKDVYTIMLNSSYDKSIFDIQCYWATIPTYHKKK